MTTEHKKYEYLKFNKSLNEEYLLLQEKYEKIYNKDFTVVLMQVGSFHEIYATNDRGYDLHKLSNILNIIVSKKNKKNPEVSEKNPYMIGFPILATPKFINILVDNGFHVIKIDQVTPPPNPKRAITQIYSPGSYIEGISSYDSNYILSIYIEEIKQMNNSYILFAGLSIIDLSVGKCIIHETFSTKDDEKYSLDEVLKFIYNFNPKEIIVYYKNLITYSENELLTYLELNDKKYLISEFSDNEYTKIIYQNNFLKEIYNLETCMTHIEELDLERINNGRLSFILLLNYCKKMNSTILNNIYKPEFYLNTKYLHYGNNALKQLNVQTYNSNEKSLFDVINYTSTSMGKRYLNFNICNPISDVNILNDRYDKISELKEKNIDLSDKLKKILDIERLHRKISLQNLNPHNFVDLHISYSTILSLYEDIKKTKLNEIYNEQVKMNLENYISYYSRLFNLDEMEKYNLNDITNSFYNENINEKIDMLQKSIKKEYKLIENLRDDLEKFIDCKKKDYFNSFNEDKSPIQINYNEKDKYHFSTTSKRGSILKNNIKNNSKYNYDSYKFKDQSNTMKITCTYVDNISDKLVILNDKIRPLIKNTYLNDLKEMYEKYNDLYLKINNIIAEIDFINSGSICSIRNKYCKPKIILKDKSFMNVKSIRHPIIEQICSNKYVPHNLNLDDNQTGILLYGLNSAGKSSLMKSIGLNVILAQIGYFVSASEFVFSPYKSLFTRISNIDNIYKGLSSFALELVELNAILKRSGSNTLVLSDEVCKGTEYNSALIIVSAMIKMLVESNTSFISATHLHELTKLDAIKCISKIGIYHISVKYINNNIIFNRLLKKGNGTEEYGLDFAKYMIKNNKFIDICNDIKKDINNITVNKSKYNKNLIVDKCQICKSIKNLETHHIEFQKNTDEYGFIIKKTLNHIHKDHISNLVILCSECHDEIHSNKIIMKGYEDTIKGSILKYKRSKCIEEKKYNNDEIKFIINKPNISQKKVKDLFEKQFKKKITIKNISKIINNKY